jgi:hypothetical protein
LQIFTEGSGPPLVLIPRLEGRWEYMRAAADALARSFRVVTFSLAGEPSSGVALDRAASRSAASSPSASQRTTPIAPRRS